MMGKIFDALEKANIQASKNLFSVRNRNGEKIDASRAENVVTIGNVNRTASNTKIHPNLITYHSPQSVEAEHFKVLRTNLLFPSTGNPPRTILITSALPNDGKSFISSNLASSIAQGIEEYVMLVDCDMRKPTIHSYFGYEHVIGLSEHLSSGTELSKVLLKTSIPKLSILPAGQPPGNPTELLSSKKMKALLKEVTNRYDDRYIIIDSPPPTMAAETMAMVSLVDGVILVVKAGKTPKKAVAETIEQIGKDKFLGIVMNYSELSSKKFYGYGKKYYQKK